jgi:microcystin-dependent protein
MEPFIGQIQAFGFNFAPRGWASCDGQLIAINQNTALFSLLGTTYGGDGRTTFALPDLRGRTMLSAGNGLGLSDRRLGSQGGSENNTLTVNQLPSHNHALGAGATVSIPVSGEDADPDGVYGSGPLPLSGNTANQGGQQAFNNMQPYLVVNICIALQGIFPSRN